MKDSIKILLFIIVLLIAVVYISYAQVAITIQFGDRAAAFGFIFIMPIFCYLMVIAAQRVFK